jgi:hypothetical protein
LGGLRAVLGRIDLARVVARARDILALPLLGDFARLLIPF